MEKLSFYLFESASAYRHWLIFIVCVVVGFSLKGTFIFLVEKCLKSITRNFFKKDFKWFATFKTPLIYLSLFYFYLLCIYLIDPDKAGFHFVISTLKVALSINCIFIIQPTLYLFVDCMQKRFQEEKNLLHDQFFRMTKQTLSIFVFVFGGLMIFQNMGYNVTSLIAGLGIGGVAVALAAKDTISNFFGSITILFDKPFLVGDWVHFEDTEGIVERIGFRSTQIKTFYDSVISIPNSVLANIKIDNLGKRQARRTRFNLGLTYSTPSEKIKTFVEGIEEIIHLHPKTKKDYFQVYFSGYGDSSLNIFVNLFFQVSNWNEELKARQSLFLEILNLAKKIEVEFAFPSQSLYIEKMTHSIPRP